MRSWHVAFFPKSWLFVMRWFWNEKNCMGETCGVFFCSADANASLQVICHPQICKCRDAWCVCSYLCACVCEPVWVDEVLRMAVPFREREAQTMCRTHSTYRSELNTLAHTQLKLSHISCICAHMDGYSQTRWQVTMMLGEHKHILCALREVTVSGELLAECLCTGSKRAGRR